MFNTQINNKYTETFIDKTIIKNEFELQKNNYYYTYQKCIN